MPVLALDLADPQRARGALVEQRDDLLVERVDALVRAAASRVGHAGTSLRSQRTNALDLRGQRRRLAVLWRSPAPARCRPRRRRRTGRPRACARAARCRTRARPAASRLARTRSHQRLARRRPPVADAGHAEPRDRVQEAPAQVARPSRIRSVGRRRADQEDRHRCRARRARRAVGPASSIGRSSSSTPSTPASAARCGERLDAHPHHRVGVSEQHERRGDVRAHVGHQIEDAAQRRARPPARAPTPAGSPDRRPSDPRTARRSRSRRRRPVASANAARRNAPASGRPP